MAETSAEGGLVHSMEELNLGLQEAQAKKVDKFHIVDGSPSAKVLTDSQDEIYNSNYPERGLCVIFNHKYFHRSLQMNERSGTDRDRNKLCSLFRRLGFKVDLHNDLLVSKIKEKLFYYTTEVDHSNYDCFVMFFMSHGEEGILYAYDNIFKAEDLFRGFTADVCTTLAGKPKMFFIQACRGDRLDDGVHLFHYTSSSTTVQTDQATLSLYKIPNNADFLVSWSTISGHFSWRNTSNGSWFIQSLVEVFETYANMLDVLSMMTYVNRIMILNYESYCPNKSKMHGKKQTACIMSTLMRLVYIRPKILSLWKSSSATSFPTGPRSSSSSEELFIAESAPKALPTSPGGKGCFSKVKWRKKKIPKYK